MSKNTTQLNLNSNWILIIQISAGVVSFIFFIIALAGLAAAQNDCNNVLGNSPRASRNTCYHAFRFEWFQLFFELFMLVGLAASITLNTLSTFKTLFLALFLLLTGLVMRSTDIAITQADGASKSQYDARAAGWVLISLLNVAIVFILSVEPLKVVQIFKFGKMQDPQRPSQFNVQDFDNVDTRNSPRKRAQAHPVEHRLPSQNQIDEENPKPNALQEVELESDSPTKPGSERNFE